MPIDPNETPEQRHERLLRKKSQLEGELRIERQKHKRIQAENLELQKRIEELSERLARPIAWPGESVPARKRGIRKLLSWLLP
jgi:hypothetical protein